MSRRGRRSKSFEIGRIGAGRDERSITVRALNAELGV